MACIHHLVVLRRNVYVPVQMNVMRAMAVIQRVPHSVMNNHISADTEGHLPGETHDHYALAEGDAAANTKMSECEVEQSNFFFRPNIRPFILATRTMVCDLLAHMESLDEGPEKIQIF